ncbi:carbohydrate esterase family 5 protein [Cylindrobasidium torrendii FP15055 ss-10]|uniref:Carbohydrate esterase family 5 protein n=1 Tax=Cylindrobasidium torrendii FP15055 ss-10 TaxID=1314674 RepID=A0A0D7BN49_9AGAR|nr:carbohydrate esterase family 5 protein [Cylindrobasidium torrendii FP15055 ss-10]
MFSVFQLLPTLLASTVLASPVVERQDCVSVLLVHAAGTFEEGIGQVGGPLSEALGNSSLSSFAGQALNYSTIQEYNTTLIEGANTLAALLTSQLEACPEQKFILGGYSKGVMVIHLTNLTEAAQSAVCGIAGFGDPYAEDGVNGDLGLANRFPIDNANSVIVKCNDGDPICHAGATGGEAAHTAYGHDGSTDDAAAFLAGVCA